MSREIPRLEMAELDPALAQALGPRLRRLGYLGEFFRCCGHQPEALLAFMAFTDTLKAALPDPLTETVALTVAATCGNAYERHQHERLSETLGFSRDWIAAVLRLDGHGLDPTQAAAQQLALAMLRDHGRGASDALAAMVEAGGAATAVAVMLLVGRYVAHAQIVNALALAPPVASIFDETPSNGSAGRPAP